MYIALVFNFPEQNKCAYQIQHSKIFKIPNFKPTAENPIFLLWVTKTPLPLSSSRPTWRNEYKRLLESLYFNRLQLFLIIQRWILVPLILNVVFCMGVSSHPFMRGDQRQFDFVFFKIQGVQDWGCRLYTIEPDVQGHLLGHICNFT